MKDIKLNPGGFFGVFLGGAVGVCILYLVIRKPILAGKGFLIGATAGAFLGNRLWEKCFRRNLANNDDQWSFHPGMESNLILVGEEVSSLHNQIELSGNSISFDLRQANRAHSILIVQDVDQGPSPVHQSIISQLNDTLVDRVIWMTVGITIHTDPELLELEALEILELFASAGLDGDQILFGYDSNAVKLQFPLPQMSLVGIKQLNNTLLNRTDQIYSNEFPTRKD